MHVVKLDPRIENDTYLLGHFGESAVLLMRNACYPWLMLVPNTLETEFHRLDEKEQQQLISQASQLAKVIEIWQPIDKMNIATIGNVVSQLHIHIVGRRSDDPSWPGVVWGAQPYSTYTAELVNNLYALLVDNLSGDYRAAEKPVI